MRDPRDYAGTWIFLKKAKWKESFALFPHRCRISKRWIWLKKAYKGVATYTTSSLFSFPPSIAVKETQWHESGEHIKWLLTRDTNETIDSLMAQDIVGVQPMTSQIASIFKFKQKK